MAWSQFCKFYFLPYLLDSFCMIYCLYTVTGSILPIKVFHPVDWCKIYTPPESTVLSLVLQRSPGVECYTPPESTVLSVVLQIYRCVEWIRGQFIRVMTWSNTGFSTKHQYTSLDSSGCSTPLFDCFTDVGGRYDMDSPWLIELFGKHKTRLNPLFIRDGNYWRRNCNRWGFMTDFCLKLNSYI